MKTGIIFSDDAFIEDVEKILAMEYNSVRKYQRITEILYICGYCYTQVTDVQQEKNGVPDMERHFRIDFAIIKR